MANEKTPYLGLITRNPLRLLSPEFHGVPLTGAEFAKAYDHARPLREGFCLAEAAELLAPLRCVQESPPWTSNIQDPSPQSIRQVSLPPSGPLKKGKHLPPGGKFHRKNRHHKNRSGFFNGLSGAPYTYPRNPGSAFDARNVVRCPDRFAGTRTLPNAAA